MWLAFLLWSWRFSECMVPGAVDPQSSCCSCCDLARTQPARGCERVSLLPGHLLQATPAFPLAWVPRVARKDLTPRETKLSDGGTIPETGSGRQPGERWTDRRTTGGALPCAGARCPYPARRHVRQQNWMNSFRSQSRLDLTISQNVSSAGFPERRKEGQVSRGGQTWLLPAPHSRRQPSAVTPVVTGGQLSEARAGAEPGDEGGWGRRRVGGWGWSGSGDAGLCGEPSMVTVPLSGRGRKRGQTWRGQGGGCCVMLGMPQWGGGMMRGRGSSGHREWLREGKSQAPKASPSPGSWPLGTCTHGAGTASLYGAGTSPEKMAS